MDVPGTHTESVWLQPNVSGYYFLALKGMMTRLSAGTAARNPEFIAFVITLAAALESLLNDLIIGQMAYTFEPEHYRKYAEALIGMSARNKLEYIVPLCSDNQFVLKRDSSTYQQLTKLVSRRNCLMHNKAYLQEYQAEFHPIDAATCNINIKVPYSTMDPALGITLQECTDYFDALKSFLKVMSSKAWLESALICRNPGAADSPGEQVSPAPSS